MAVSFSASFYKDMFNILVFKFLTTESPISLKSFSICHFPSKYMSNNYVFAGIMFSIMLRTLFFMF